MISTKNKNHIIVSLLVGVGAILLALRAGSSGQRVTDFDFEKAAMHEFVEYCDEHRVGYWKFGLPMRRVLQDSSREFRWLFSRGQDSVEIVVVVPYAEKRSLFSVRLPAILSEYSSIPDGWIHLGREEGASEKGSPAASY